MKFRFKKILIIGSGAIKIGQAGEFDYSGSQAIKSIKEEGIKVVLVNPNIATIQTSENFADKVYFLPIDKYSITKIIEKENPDGILLGFGGQTALNVGIELYDEGILEKNNVKVLGTSVEAIKITEDRKLFNEAIISYGYKVPKSFAVNSVEKAIEAGENLGFPVMIRIAFALGGLGSGIVYNKEDLEVHATKALNHANQILVEECLVGWKELEYEIVRDERGNCISVCSMENFDPMGVHTGESIVVAPIQTLTAKEHFNLRSIAINTIRKLGIIGECNIQFAFSPIENDYRIIEVNPRLSRSSALASKATGYPLAYIAAKLSLGFALSEIENLVTQTTAAFFEPALDYIVVKIPRWDLSKFKNVHTILGSEMKSVGEVMSIGKSFEEAIQKAFRMLDIGADGVISNKNMENLDFHLTNPNENRVFAICNALKKDYSIDKLHELTKIDRWFLYGLQNIVNLNNRILKHKNINELSADAMLFIKQNGFSDKYLSKLFNINQIDVRNYRKKLNITPFVKQIDTLAGEFPAKTNYLYTTYHGNCHDVEFNTNNQVILLGSGTYRIGCSVEFDWCCVSCNDALKEMNYKTIMINYNPETVSTDYDICDKLYFDEISFEKVMDIYELEKNEGVIISMGGQIANNLALSLHKQNVKILGTNPEKIDQAEDRHKFSTLLDNLKIDQPEWKELSDLESAKKFAKEVEYPVIIRPSYVLSGAAMSICLDENELTYYLKTASDVNKEHPVVISKFITDAKEIDVDAVAKDGKIYAFSVSLHLENAGVHSGDATLVLPPNTIYLETLKQIENITNKIAIALNINGPFNMQFLAKNNQLKVIECNLRASRSMPFVSKVLKTNFIKLATKIIMGKDVQPITQTIYNTNYIGVKASQFSFTRLKGSDPIQTVEMTSTGEVGCLGSSFNDALKKSLISVGYKIPKKKILISSGNEINKIKLLDSVKLLHKNNFELYTTKGTQKFLESHNIPSKLMYWPSDKIEPNAVTYIKNKNIELVINIPKNAEKLELENDYTIRRLSVDFNIPLITNVQLAISFINMIIELPGEEFEIKSWDEY